MKYMDIYNGVTNPLDEDRVLDILAQAYSQRHFGLGGFYSQLVTTTEKEYKGRYNPEEYNKFYATAFNKWKNGIVSLTKEEFEELKARKSYDDRLIKLRNYLKTVPDVKTEEEARKIMNQDFNDDDLNNAMEDYRWDSISWGTGWEHVKSRYLNGKRGNDIQVTHRLYLNVEPIDVYTVANELIKKCDEHEMPYYFKFDNYGNRDDTLVVYSDTEKLPFYIEKLQEIAKENPEIRARSKTPPVLTGKIDGWIGYGSEPEVKNGTRSSFNLVRSKCIEQAFTEEFENWFSTNKNSTVTYHGKTLTLMEYIAVLRTKQELSKMKKRLELKPDNKTQEEYENRLGYNSNDLKKPSLISKIYSGIKKSIQDNWGNPNQKYETIKVNNGTRTISIYGYKVKDLKDLVVPYVMKHDEDFRKRVKNKIKELSAAEGIDIEKYCFDISSKERLLKQDQNNEQMEKLYQSAQKYAKKHGISEPRAKGLYESNKAYLNYLSQYAKDNNIKTKKASPEKSTSMSDTTYRLKKDQIIQDLPIYSKEPSRYQGRMPDEEIKQSRIKLGFISPDIQPDTTYHLKKDQIIQDLPIYSKEPSRYQGRMTEEEIRGAQKKIGVCKK